MGFNPYKRHPMSPAQLTAYAARRRKTTFRKRIAITVVAVVAAVAVMAGGFYLWFVLSLDNALSQNSSGSTVATLKEAEPGEPFYMLVLGSDERHDERNPEVSQRSDVIILTRVDAKNRTITMLSVPRDTKYQLEDGSVVKINELYNIGGVAKAVEGVSKLAGVPISHYMVTYMSDVKNVVNELGGVEINVENEINNNDPETEENVNIMPGLQTLDGRQAQAYAIARHDVEDGSDSHRQDKIRNLVRAVIEKALDRPVLEIPSTVISLAKYLETDLRAQGIIGLAFDFFTGSGKTKIYQASAPSEGSLDEELGVWYVDSNPEGWAKVMEVIDSGGDPSTVKY